MQKRIGILLTALILLGLLGCARKETNVVRTYEATDAELMEAHMENNEPVILETYCEMRDGTWRAGEHTYQYRLEITGRMNNAAKDSTFVYLSNSKDISFEQAWKASGLSSNREDYFPVEEAKLVAIQ